MTRKRLFLITVIALIMVLTLGTVVNGSSTSKNLATNFTLVNLSDQDATGTITYVKEDGSAWTGSSVTSFGPGQDYELPADGGSLQVRQYADTITSGRGSVMVSSDVQLGAVVQERLGFNDPSLPTSGAYLGVTGGSSKYYVPLAQSRRSTSTGVGNTQIAIQNVGTSAIATITVTLYAEPGSGATPASYVKTISNLQPNASYFYDLADETNLGANWTGSAVVDAGSGSVAVVVNSFNGANGLRVYNAFPENSVYPKWAIPLFASRLSNGLTTTVNVQNLSGGSIPANGITLDCGSGFTMKNNVAIADKANFAFNPVSNTPAQFPDNWQGACTLDAGSYDVVSFVIMRRLFNNGDQAAYEALSYASTDTTLFVPLAAKRLANGFATSVVIQNLSDEDATVNVIWTPNLAECQADPCNSYTENGVSIEANGMINYNLRLTDGGPSGMPSGWQGTVKVVPADSGNAKPIVGYVVLSSLVNTAGDNYRAHIALTLP